MRSETAKLLVNLRQQLLGGLRIAVVEGTKELRDVGH
jgi:hypothetical protein